MMAKNIFIQLVAVSLWCFALQVTESKQCVDNLSVTKHCEGWKKAGLCETKKSAMLKYCPKTCGFCGLLDFIHGKVGMTHGCDRACQMECLSAHNKYRLNHGASPVVFDQKLANSAQRWADKKILAHSPLEYGGTGGESIAWGGIFPSYASVVKAFHDEERDYDYNTGSSKNGQEVGHFTQVVWKPMKRIGCSRTTIRGMPWYVVHYNKVGIVSEIYPGHEKENVGRPKHPDVLVRTK
uniref:Toxin candidate TRINITY_DN28823_c0_g1_i1 n=1 Tax=Pachycerianthus borealis TaxID=2736680 RepID=A0A7G7WYY1_9CNID|nr:toxin candidate TRINITY_DN28823_c0_g1_i1 [Pachycerianthus borealis]